MMIFSYYSELFFIHVNQNGKGNLCNYVHGTFINASII